MKSKNDRQVAPEMVEDKETERRKKREQAAGRLVIADERKATPPSSREKGSQP